MCWVLHSTLVLGIWKKKSDNYTTNFKIFNVTSECNQDFCLIDFRRSDPWLSLKIAQENIRSGKYSKHVFLFTKGCENFRQKTKFSIFI